MVTLKKIKITVMRVACYKDLIENKEEPQVIISLLESNIRLILCTKILLEEGYTKENIVAHLKEFHKKLSLTFCFFRIKSKRKSRKNHDRI